MTENLHAANHVPSRDGGDNSWLPVVDHARLPCQDGGSSVASAPANKLYFGDNLTMLREHVKDESVDLIYLDPPFNSNANYNVLFGEQGGNSEAQAEAFRDTWGWGEAASLAYHEVEKGGGETAVLLRALRTWLGESGMMAYLAMMTIRLQEMHRTLSHRGSLFLHCDPTASHYLKLILDSIFGHDCFRNEIIWKRKAGRGETNNAAIRFGVSHDDILFYARSSQSIFQRQYRPNNPEYISSKFTHVDASGRRYRLDNLTSPSMRPNLKYVYKGYQPPEKGWAVSLETMKKMDAEGRVHFPDLKTKRLQRKRFLDELPGETVDTLWDDIPPINSQAQERLGYPTQKPLNLLERIINAATLPDATILDPFCGCGTSVEAAEKLGRRWLGIDVTHYAITLIEKRLSRYAGCNYRVYGRPTDLAGAHDLARRDKYQFQWWAAWMLGAQTYETKKGADRGIDANIYFANGPYGLGRIILSVKGGDHVSPAMVRELSGVVQREGADMGILVTLAEPTKSMRADASGAGFVSKSAHGKLPRIQIATIEDLLDRRFPKLPPLPQPIEMVPRSRAMRDRDQLEFLLPIAGHGVLTDAGAFRDPKFMKVG
ncbi:site-specific DNA-methyltransferase (adenine-specific) [Bradyrhizobium stylosanthis]|uniref:site-specific DNA-methyltransferase (adenine-specific) n=1 Tax=Bradyrhizobium stylosanthis TaxID=1803665 RepID=A0A560CX36_9BRAD|nr:site-specific DNA-methyltransferase (adenine-specific) [Bradyrhizobium stylosanthis]